MVCSAVEKSSGRAREEGRTSQWQIRSSRSTNAAKKQWQMEAKLLLAQPYVSTAALKNFLNTVLCSGNCLYDTMKLTYSPFYKLQGRSWCTGNVLDLPYHTCVRSRCPKIALATVNSGKLGPGSCSCAIKIGGMVGGWCQDILSELITSKLDHDLHQ